MARSEVTSGSISVQNVNLLEKLSTCPSGYSHARRGAAMALPPGSKFRHTHKRDCHRHIHFTSRKGAPSTSNACCIINLYSWSSADLLHATYSSNVKDSAFETDFINTAFLMLYSLDFEENRLKRNILFDLWDVQIFPCLYLITDCINSALLQTSVFYLITAWSHESRLFFCYLLFSLLIYLCYFLCCYMFNNISCEFMELLNLLLLYNLNPAVWLLT